MPEPLRLEGVRPEQREGVFLNEELVLHFSEPLDPASVTAASVGIRPVSADGRPSGPPARGRFTATGRALVFTPEPVLAFDLSDGGYLPGASYAIELAGFPRPDGLRAKDGAPLAASARIDFTVVELEGREPLGGFAFEDPVPGRGLPVLLRTEVVAPGEPIELEGGEPLDPSTLYAADFVLRAGPRVRSELGPPIPLRVRLVDNRDRQRGAGTALIHVLPMERLEPGETYQLIVDERLLRLRDQGGHRVLVRNARGRAKLEVRVAPPTGAPVETYAEYTETFIDERMRSPEAVPGVDGTIRWTDTGRAELRFPAAAGSGEDGEVELPAHHLAHDVQALRLALQAGARTELNPLPGLVVLRAQGRLAVGGRLERRTERTFEADAALPFLLEASERADSLRASNESARPGEALTAWLARARADELDWTVLVAGGDLSIEGGVLTDRPLLLAAGGEIRVAAGAVLEAPFVATVGQRRGVEVRYREGRRLAHAWRADLALDTPEANPLAGPLRFGVRSGPIPELGGARRWHPGPRVGGHAGSGSWHVRYLGRARGSSEVEPVVDDPAMLEESPTLRFEVLFDLPAGGGPTGGDPAPWDPPWLDSIQLRWDPLARGLRPGEDRRAAGPARPPRGVPRPARARIGSGGR